VRISGHDTGVRARTVVLASGGFESNLEWLKEIWGSAADNFIIRGTPYNRGTVLKQMLACGGQPVGDPAQCHAVAWTPRPEVRRRHRHPSRLHPLRDRRQCARRAVLR